MQATLTRVDLFALLARRLRGRIGEVRIFALHQDPYEPETMGGPVVVVVSDDADAVREVTADLAVELEEAAEVPFVYTLASDALSGDSVKARAVRDEGVEL